MTLDRAPRTVKGAGRNLVQDRVLDKGCCPGRRGGATTTGAASTTTTTLCSLRARDEQAVQGGAVGQRGAVVVSTVTPGSPCSPGQPISTTTRSGRASASRCSRSSTQGWRCGSRTRATTGPCRPGEQLVERRSWLTSTSGARRARPRQRQPPRPSPTATLLRCAPQHDRAGRRAARRRPAARAARPRWTRSVSAGLAVAASGARSRPASATRPAASARRCPASTRPAPPRRSRRHRDVTVRVLVRAQAEQVAAGGQGEHGGGRPPRPPATARHVQRVGHHQAVEAQLLAQQATAPSARGWPAAGVQRGQQHVGGHHRHGAGRHGAANGTSSRARRVLLARRRWAGRGGSRPGVAVAGEVLDAGGDAGRLQARTRPRRAGRPAPGRRRSCAPDHRVVRVAVDVEDGREVEVDPGSGQRRPDRAGDPLGQLDVVDRAQGGVARVGAPSAWCSRVTSPPSSSVATSTSGRRACIAADQGAQVVGQRQVGPEQAQRAQAARAAWPPTPAAPVPEAPITTRRANGSVCPDRSVRSRPSQDRNDEGPVARRGLRGWSGQTGRTDGLRPPLALRDLELDPLVLVERR